MAKKTTSRDLIFIAMYQLMLKKEYDDICVKDICDKANVSRMSFYRYFNNKEDIFITICDERFAEFYESFISNKEPTFEMFLKDIMAFFKRYSKEIKILKKAGKINMLIDQFLSYASYLLNRLKGGENIKKYRNNPLTIPFFSGALFMVLVSWCNNNFKDTEETMTKRLFDLMNIEN